ncbi:hypothetical protein [Aquibium oceanicum]|uniref:Uncharacterized protein n=1 Tax=Aquibium oceanicum TaxID=1670800 RepID=A0A1L3SPW4_9HYPH|nr:hypothetical protein [Aquibium oceanicum]APH71438.1 hypothetical protein BSQ44_08705 [Aquibium oceanicum]
MEAAVSKGAFAALIGVSPGRVSQYLAEGKIAPASLQGSGRSAKIIVERAKADLRLTLDISQRLGNGIETRLDADDPEADAGTAAPQDAAPAREGRAPQPTGVEYEIKQQKLEQLRRANRNAAIADAEASGTLVETEASRAGMMRVATGMMLVFEGGLTDLANAVAAEFKVPQRDVLHLMRREFRKIRTAAAKQAAAEGAAMPETVETVLEADEISTVN